MRDLGVKKALPVLEARLARESADFGGSTRRVLKEAIDALRGKGGEPKEAVGATTEQAKTIAELERQAAELDLKTKELRSRISALKHAPEQGGQAAGTASSHTAH